MDGQVPSLLLLDPIQGLADGLYRLIGAGEGVVTTPMVFSSR